MLGCLDGWTAKGARNETKPSPRRLLIGAATPTATATAKATATLQCHCLGKRNTQNVKRRT